MTNHTTLSGLIEGEAVIARIQNRRGNRVNLPQPLAPGELGWCLDTRQLYVGLTEEEAIAGLEIYRGNVINAQILVQDILNRKIMEFNSFYSRVNTTVQLIQDPATSVTEEELISDLGDIQPSIFVDQEKRAIVEELEQNIEYIRDLNAATYLSTGFGGPAVDDFSAQTMITYDWITQAQTAAVLEVTGETGGIIDTVSLVSGGLGYIADVLPSGTTVALNQGTSSGTGIGAVFTCNIDTSNPEGVLLSVASVDTPGTLYTVGDTITLDAPNQISSTATATANLVTGSIASMTVVTGGYDYGGVPAYTIVGDGSGAELEIIVSGGVVTAINVTQGGIGYTVATVTIEPPKSTTLYKFRYDVGVDDQPGNPFTLPPVYTRLTNAIASLISYVNVDDCGVLGLDPTGTTTDPLVGPFFPRGAEMVNGFLLLETTRQSSNVAALINELTTVDTGLVTTKQNVEIMTEFSNPALAVDAYIEAPIRYEIANGTAQISNASGDLAYNVAVSDSQIIQYSIHDPVGDFNQIGTLLVTSNATAAASAVLDTSTSVGTGTAVSFAATYTAGVIGIESTSAFANDVTMSITSKKWKSF